MTREAIWRVFGALAMVTFIALIVIGYLKSRDLPHPEGSLVFREWLFLAICVVLLVPGFRYLIRRK